jgi:large subunit ribosomal protein L4
LNPYFFDCKPRKDILHQMVVWQLAKRRAGTHKTKYRRETAYTKKKMYQQKGTGRARHSDKGAPIFRGGGHTFPKRPRDYSFKLNKKIRRLALRMALTTKYKQGKLVVLEDLNVVDSTTGETLWKTKATRQAVENLLPSTRSYLFIDGEKLTESFQRGSFNVRNIDHLPVKGLNVYDMLRRDTLVLTRSALEYLNSKYSEYIKLNE